MSIFTALNTAVLGLQSQSAALEAISGNIANSQTVGYKRLDTGFEDLVTSSNSRLQPGGSVAAFSRGTSTIAGSTSSTGIATNFALNGAGFVAVKQAAIGADGKPAFSGAMQFTRRGDFQLDRNGYLVNGAGNYLCGYPVDPATGVVTGTTPDVVKTAVGLSPARATTRLGYTANLPAEARTPARIGGTATSDVWTAAGGTAPATVSPTTTPASPSFAANSITGQTARLYDAKGQPVDVALSWAKVASTADGATKWGLYYNSTPGAAAKDATWKLAQSCTFGPGGTLVSPTAAADVDLSSMGLGTISLDLTGGRLTQYADPAGEARVTRIEQDGYPAGDVTNLSVSENGRVVANFSNGQMLDIAQIALARFSAPDQLVRGSGGTFEQSAASGEPTFQNAGTSFSSGAVEGSNTDVAEEFSKMIVTQQAYSANTRVVSTAQQMLQEVMNVIR